ncbi:hypothetical protein [Amycolatopsis sp. NPDC051716]|uniref:hypothetical protein n=1 Tax=Amycolatopsis sp. NPDC051716 TaxID=3155804 RepID=UPI00342F00EA
MTVSASSALSVLPSGLRDDLLGAFNEIAKNYRQRHWEPAELNGGKLCEAAYSVVRGHIDGNYPPRASGPRNMLDACKQLEKETNASRSFRIQIPRIIVALYEIRNNRGVGHAGASIDPNHMDATVVLYMSKWLLSEIIRELHSLSTDEAAAVIESLTQRETELLWIDGDKRRVLAQGLTWRQRALLLLLSKPDTVSENELLAWLEHPQKARLRRDILRPAHKERLIEFDETSGTVTLLPPGIAEAEAILLKTTL